MLATSITYFSGQDGKFAQGLNLRGTASANTVTGKTAVISASYSDPIGTLAATGTTTTLKLEYSPLNNYAARAELLAGTYRGGSVFGGGWMLTIGAQGAVSGYVGSCSLTGSAGIQSSGSAGLQNQPESAGRRSAVPEYWNRARRCRGSQVRSHHGLAHGHLGADPQHGWSANHLRAEWQCRCGESQPTFAGGAKRRRSLGGNRQRRHHRHHRHHSRGVARQRVFFLQARGHWIRRSVQHFVGGCPKQPFYSGGLAVNATARTGVSFVGNYADPTLAGARILFDTGPDPEYPYASPITQSITALAGQDRSNVLGFGGVSTSLDVSPLGALKGSTSDGCELDAQPGPYPASPLPRGEAGLQMAVLAGRYGAAVGHRVGPV